MDQVKTIDSAIVCADENDADPADIDMAIEKLEKEAVEVNVRNSILTLVIFIAKLINLFLL